jgi:hypothetical protein
MTRFLRLLSVPTLAAGLLGGLGATGSAMAFTAAGRAHLEIVKVPVSSLIRATPDHRHRAKVGRPGGTPDV